MTTTLWVIAFIVGLSCLVGFAVRMTIDLEGSEKRRAKRKDLDKSIAGYRKAYERGNFEGAEAQEHLKSALKLVTEFFEPTDWRFVEIFKNYARSYPNGGYALMALATEDVLTKMAALGPKHPDVADGLDKLAGLYSDLQVPRVYVRWNWTDAAMVLYKRALKIREKALGRNHPDVAISLHNMAAMHDSIIFLVRDEVQKSFPLYKRALAVREKALGPEHIDVADSLDCVAPRAPMDEAEGLHMRALTIKETVLGQEHPFVAPTLKGLAKHYGLAGRSVDAESCYRKALEIQEKGLGPEHPDVAESLADLARFYFDQERYEEAEPLFLRSLSIFIKALRMGHLDHERTVELRELREMLDKGIGNELSGKMLYLRVEKGPEDFVKGKEVSFERILATEEQINLLKLVTRSSKKLPEEEGMEGGIVECESITPQATLEQYNIVPKKPGHPIWHALGEVIELYGWLLHKTGRGAEAGWMDGWVDVLYDIYFKI